MSGSTPEPPLDEYTAAVMIAALRAINSEYPFEPLNRSNLLEAAYGLIGFLVRTAKPDEPHLIGKFAELNILLTKLLDQVVLNASESDECIHVLRKIASNQPCWPTLVRPGDPEFSGSKVERLSVGTNSGIRRLTKNAKRPPSFKTARNRVTSQLLERLRNIAYVISTTGDDELALQHIKMTVPEAREGERATQLLPILREINHHSGEHSPLTSSTVSIWSRWLTEFVFIVDPELTTYSEFRKVKLGKPAKSKLRSNLQKFFHPALTLLAL
jgi:hypothetical protein